MATEIDRVRERLRAEQSVGRVSAEVRREAVTVVERLRAAGRSYRAIAAELGINRHTLMGWRQRVKQAVLEPVRVARSASDGVVVHGPRGLRVEGLAVSELAELWIRLS